MAHFYFWSSFNSESRIGANSDEREGLHIRLNELEWITWWGPEVYADDGGAGKGGWHSLRLRQDSGWLTLWKII